MSKVLIGGSWYVLSSGIILGITGVAKLLSAFSPVKLLTISDPIFGISFGHLMLAVGVVELAITVVCFQMSKHIVGVSLVALLSTNFAFYRLTLWLIDWKSPCVCLGNLTDGLHITPRLADNLMKAVLAYLLIGSYSVLFWRWKQFRKATDLIQSHSATSTM